ncbi:hypothetical protein C8A05DRAFT_18611 [Staphylotrichum tortipilum]|uniref:Golgi apparatus membrane protein TVP38 n=1 Tax=Staphylotrichum tortipilum TaxID=2831512 RepID=A0AAN6ME75_9PEZI|nr:hypothetical protein C8A05DRAFT_18611 [Staphylotrichum longicolle]
MPRSLSTDNGGFFHDASSSPSPRRTPSPQHTTIPTITTTRPSLSPDDDNDDSNHPRPAWTPRPTPPGARRLSARRNQQPSPSSSGPKALLASLTETATSILQHSLRLYLSLTPTQRVLVLLASGVVFTLGILFLVYSHRIFAALGPVAASIRSHPAGWLPIFLAIVATGFPPIIGYSTCVTVAGFVYGFPLGWPIAAAATVVGSTGAFLTSRGALKGYVQRLVGRDKRFIALGQVLRRDGIVVLVMIRLCPLPYSLSNGFLATVGSIRTQSFALATAAATPKLLVHVFIGSRLALLAESGDTMTGFDRFINYASMAVFGGVGFVVTLLIYRRTMARAAELAGTDDVEAGDALFDGTPLGEDDDDDEEEGVTGRGSGEDGRMVHPDELDAAALMDDDDISLWETEGGDGYRDSWDDEPAKTTTTMTGINGSRR